MTPEEFISCVCTEVIDETNNAYAELLANSSSSQATDEYWSDVLTLYNSLDDKGKSVIRKIMCQVSVDTLSGIFAILDGAKHLERYPGEFCVTYEGGTPMNGELQDHLLANSEE